MEDIFLLKDTKQLKANYRNISENLISVIVVSNTTRKDHIAQEIINRKQKVVGIYRLTMKRIKAKRIEVVVYEPTLKEEYFFNSKVIRNIKEFKEISDVIVVNRTIEEMRDVQEKVYTRYLYERD